MVEAGNSISQMEATCCDLKESISDFLTMMSLNVKALEVESIQPAITQQLAAFLEDVRGLVAEIEEKRLQLLIAEQIVFEDIQLRRERMQEYEDKIQEKRRAVADKQAVFQGYTNPKKKRSQLVRLEEFERVKAIEKLQDNFRYLVEYERHYEQIKLLNNFLKNENKQLIVFAQKTRNYSRYCRKRLKFTTAISNSKETYDAFLNEADFQDFLTIKGPTLKPPMTTYPIISQNEKGTHQMEEIVQKIRRNKKLMKSLRQQTELSEYLSQENASLISRYQAAQDSQGYAHKPSPKWHTESTTEVL